MSLKDKLRRCRDRQILKQKKITTKFVKRFNKKIYNLNQIPHHFKYQII